MFGPHATNPSAAPAPTSASTTGEAAPSGAVVTEQTALTEGERMEILDRSRWYDGHVLEVRAGGLVRVHYHGWSSRFDTDVTRDRLRVFGPAMDDAGPPGTAIDPTAALRGGDAVWALSQGHWYRAEVVQPMENGTYQVRYIGWDNSWNESLGLDRLRARQE